MDDEILGRKMPHDPMAEQAVIGSMLIDPSCIPNVIARLRADDFYIDTNREIFETALHMISFSMTIDPVTVLDQMRVRGTYKGDTSRQYVKELMSVTPTAANVMAYANIVRMRSLMRRLAETAAEISDMVLGGDGDAETMLEAAERKIFALRQGRQSGGLTPIGTIIAGVYEHLSELAEGDAIPGIKTGMSDLDSAILGLSQGDLVLIASRPGMGKTSMAMNIAVHAARVSGKKVSVFSLEMSREQLAIRLLSSESM